MEKLVQFRALLPTSVDLTALWNSIHDKEHCHLGGEGSHYVVSFAGPLDSGLTILEIVLQLDEYEISFKTSGKGGV